MVKRRIISLTFLNLKIIYELFINNNCLTIKKLAENIKTDYKNTHNAIDFLFKEGIIKKEKIGNYNICKLNYDNENLVSYLKWYNFVIKVNDFKKKYSVEYQIITETIEKLKDEMSPFFVCLVFGSYAKNEEKTGSDIDLIFLTFFSKAESIIKRALNKINAPYQKKFHVLEQSIEDFRKDLQNKDKLSIATELYKELPIIFYGDDIFLKLVIGERKKW